MSGLVDRNRLSPTSGVGARDPGAGRGAQALATGAGLPAEVRKVMVLGASRSGLAAAAAMERLGLAVVLVDRKERGSIAGLERLLEIGVEFLPEDQVASVWPAVGLVIKSPGVPGENVVVSRAWDRGVPVWSEVELAYALLPNPFDAITGTNGKTTTTALLGHLFGTAGRPARVLGNIGTAVTSVAGGIDPQEELVVEVSSFQLEDVHAFRPAVGVLLNLTPDHLDRHGTMERYLACKEKLFAQQLPADVAVINLEDAAAAGVGERLLAREEGPRVAFFSVSGAVRDRSPVSYVEEGWIVLEHERLLETREILLPGRHNLENCLAAGTSALARGIDRVAVAEGLRTFKGVAHRLEEVGRVGGVLFVNDSKATNVDATLTALRAYPQATHLILGGRDKASDYRPVARACAMGCRAVYLIGEAASLIEAAFREVRAEEGMQGVPVTGRYDDLERALRAAARSARSGEVVLLAPACASFDQYMSYEERGDHFRSLVGALGQESS